MYLVMVAGIAQSPEGFGVPNQFGAVHSAPVQPARRTTRPSVKWVVGLLTGAAAGGTFHWPPILSVIKGNERVQLYRHRVVCSVKCVVCSV